MALRIAALADTHYAPGSLESCGPRRTAIADTLLYRAINRLNRFIKPDLTIILGDLIDQGSPDHHEHLKQVLDKLETPLIVVPGNHDGNIDDFYRVYPSPADTLDINGVRIVTFIDPEEPGYRARRTETDIRRMDAARAGHDGPIISVQHVPLFPTGASASPYGYVNADEVWSAFERNNFTLSLSGHWHKGDDLIARGAGRAIIAPALCESPFAFMEITIDGDQVTTRRHELMMPPELGLKDYHVHTPFAYCQENMNIPLSIAIGREFGLAQMSFTEHSGQLYFDRDTFWKAAFMQKGLDTVDGRLDRMQTYLSEAREYCPPPYLGFEIDCDFSGNPVIKPEDFAQAQIRVGAIHWVEELMKPEPDLKRAGDEMIARLSRFLGSGIQILAHPFRTFRRYDREVELSIIPRLVSLLREHGVAAEINFHVQETSPELVKACVESGVKLVFGSDSHNLREIGEFYPHLELLHSCGYTDSDLPRILADIRPAGQ